MSPTCIVALYYGSQCIGPILAKSVHLNACGPLNHRPVALDLSLIPNLAPITAIVIIGIYNIFGEVCHHEIV